MTANTRTDLAKMPTAVFADPIYFSKFNVRTGTRIRSYGRKSYGTTWVVNSITTITSGKYGRVKHNIAYVRTLEDVVELRCEETGEFRQCRFGYLSEAARWRLDDQSSI
jgi:hypothetical protein